MVENAYIMTGVAINRLAAIHGAMITNLYRPMHWLINKHRNIGSIWWMLTWTLNFFIKKNNKFVCFSSNDNCPLSLCDDPSCIKANLITQPIRE